MIVLPMDRIVLDQRQSCCRFANKKDYWGKQCPAATVLTWGIRIWKDDADR